MCVKNMNGNKCELSSFVCKSCVFLSFIKIIYSLPEKPSVEVQLFVSGGFLITTSEEAGWKSPPRV